MKRALLPILLAFPLIPVGGCSSEDVPVVVPGTAGTDSGMAGTPAATGGTPGSAGSSVGDAGTSGTTAGTSNTGTGGASAGTTGMGGTGTGGASGSSTGGSTTGGSTTMGGTGGSGTGGSGGSGTAGSAATPVSVGKLDGMLIMTPCASSTTTDDCDGGGWIYEGKTTGCVNKKLDSDANKTILDFPVTGGVPGKRYLATMHFYGMMEPKDYGPTVTREAGVMRASQTANPATPAPFATAPAGASIAVTDYNNYEIHVFDDKGAEIKQYFINSDTQQGHYTFAISYERQIEIVAGGKVHVRTYDNNCRMIKNCLGGPPCAGKARTIDLTGADPMPTALMQPGLGLANSDAGQWFFIDVKSIVEKP